MTSQVIVGRLRHNYVRFTSLLSQLSRGTDHRQDQQSALTHFIARTAQVQHLVDRTSHHRQPTNGRYKNGLHRASDVVPSSQDSLFLQQLQQEVERIRRFVLSHAEDLWMRLLTAADDLCALNASTAEKLGHAAEIATAQQRLTVTCHQIGRQWTCCKRAMRMLWHKHMQLHNLL